MSLSHVFSRVKQLCRPWLQAALSIHRSALEICPYLPWFKFLLFLFFVIRVSMHHNMLRKMRWNLGNALASWLSDSIWDLMTIQDAKVLETIRNAENLSLFHCFVASLIHRFLDSSIHWFFQFIGISATFFFIRWCTSQLKHFIASASQNSFLSAIDFLSLARSMVSKLPPWRGRMHYPVQNHDHIEYNPRKIKTTKQAGAAMSHHVQHFQRLLTKVHLFQRRLQRVDEGVRCWWQRFHHVEGRRGSDGSYFRKNRGS